MILSILMACIHSEPKEEEVPPVAEEPAPAEADAEEVEAEPPAAPADRNQPEMKRSTPKGQSAGQKPPAEAPPEAEAPQLIGDSNVFHSPEDEAEGDDTPPQLIGDSNVFSGAQDDAPEEIGSSGFPGQVQTNTLLSSGILKPVPSTLEMGTPLRVVFNTLYPNGCWRQSEPTHAVEGFEITHQYTTYQLDNQICTMAMVPGGFNTQLTLENKGTYTGRILVDGTERTQYTVTVITSE